MTTKFTSFPNQLPHLLRVFLMKSLTREHVDLVVYIHLPMRSCLRASLPMSSRNEVVCERGRRGVCIVAFGSLQAGSGRILRFSISYPPSRRNRNIYNRKLYLCAGIVQTQAVYHLKQPPLVGGSSPCLVPASIVLRSLSLRFMLRVRLRLLIIFLPVLLLGGVALAVLVDAQTLLAAILFLL